MYSATQLAEEVATLIASHPTPEQIIAFKASEEANDRVYTLIDAERVRPLSDEEAEELESYLMIQHLMILAKAKAYLQVKQQAS